jgi:hypothetical protein
VSFSKKITAHEAMMKIQPAKSPGILLPPYVGELRRTIIAPIENGNAMETDCRIELWSPTPFSVNSPGKNIRQVKPSRINGKPNLLLSNEGPIRWKLPPIEMIIKKAQSNSLPPNMHCG